MECNVCGQTSRGWNQFKKHYRKSHKEMKQILEMCENEYDEPIENIIIDETNEGLKLILRKAYFNNFLKLLTIIKKLLLRQIDIYRCLLMN